MRGYENNHFSCGTGEWDNGRIYRRSIHRAPIAGIPCVCPDKTREILAIQTND